MKPTIAVVAVAHRSSDVLTTFIEHARVAYSGPLEIHVADNSLGADPYLGTIRDDNPDVRFHELTENRGYGAAINEVVHTLPESIQWIVAVNSDVEFGPGSLDILSAATERYPHGGAFGPSILTTDGKLYPSARNLPSLRVGVGHAVAFPIWRTNPWSRAYLQHDSEPEERTAGWLSGACVLVARPAFSQIGGFDERFFMYFEDVDLGRRLGAAGWQNVYIPASQVIHAGAHSTSRSRARMNRAHHDSAYLYITIRYRGRALAPLRLVLRVGLALRERVSSRWPDSRR